MNEQTKLFNESVLRQAFEKFHAENPDVYRLFMRFTMQAWYNGIRRYSAKSIFERIRWHTDVETKNKTDSFKLNNNYTAYYSRLAMDEYDFLNGFFEVRKIQ
jgi:hypothetical protein